MSDDSIVQDYQQTRRLTFARKSIVLEEELAGPILRGVWTGSHIGPPKQPVLVLLSNPRGIGMGKPQLNEVSRERWMRRIPGIARGLFYGWPDKQHVKPPPIGRVLVRPAGQHLMDVEALTPQEVVRLGLGLCDTIAEWGKRYPIDIGLRPETVFVAGESGMRCFSGAIPEAFIVLGGSDGPFTYDDYQAPSADAWVDMGTESAVYVLALVLWYALLKEHPFDARGGQINHMWDDKRRPFTGPPELGRLLEAVLVFDVAKRMKLPELRHELVELARVWNIELPPFPPPGL